MSLSPGIIGSPTILTDGAQVPAGKAFQANAVSEITAGNGVQLQGRTNGTAIEAGKPGQVVEGTITNGVSIGTSATVVSSDITLSAGVWDIRFMLPVAITTGATSGNSTQVGAYAAYGPSNTQIGSLTTQVSEVTNTNASKTAGLLIVWSKIYSFSGADRAVRVMALRNYEVGTGSASSTGSANGTGLFFAVRIA